MFSVDLPFTWTHIHDINFCFKVEWSLGQRSLHWCKRISKRSILHERGEFINIFRFNARFSFDWDDYYFFSDYLCLCYITGIYCEYMQRIKMVLQVALNHLFILLTRMQFYEICITNLRKIYFSRYWNDIMYFFCKICLHKLQCIDLFFDYAIFPTRLGIKR